MPKSQGLPSAVHTGCWQRPSRQDEPEMQQVDPLLHRPTQMVRNVWSDQMREVGMRRCLPPSGTHGFLHEPPTHVVPLTRVQQSSVTMQGAYLCQRTSPRSLDFHWLTFICIASGGLGILHAVWSVGLRHTTLACAAYTVDAWYDSIGWLLSVAVSLSTGLIYYHFRFAGQH